MEDKDIKMETVSVNDAIPAEPQSKDSAPDDSDAKIAELNQKVAELNDKYLRVAAELENTRRRAALDTESRARSRAMGVAEKILPVMDAVQAALKHTPDDEGIQSMARALGSSFAQIGIVKIESVGQVMNPQFHNAIQVVSAGEEINPNTIVEELQTGYMFGDTVMRTAMVVVAK